MILICERVFICGQGVDHQVFQSLYRECLEVAASIKLAGSCNVVLVGMNERLANLRVHEGYLGVAALSDLGRLCIVKILHCGKDMD